MHPRNFTSAILVFVFLTPYTLRLRFSHQLNIKCHRNLCVSAAQGQCFNSNCLGDIFIFPSYLHASLPPSLPSHHSQTLNFLLKTQGQPRNYDCSPLHSSYEPSRTFFQVNMKGIQHTGPSAFT